MGMIQGKFIVVDSQTANIGKATNTPANSPTTEEPAVASVPLAESGSPVSSSGIAQQISGSQKVQMVVDGSGYTPNSFVVKKGVPVEWEVNVQRLTGCNKELVMNQYNIDTVLKQGLNTITFTPDKAGTVQFTCGMGMLRGSFLVTETGTATTEELQQATPPKGHSCGCGGG